MARYLITGVGGFIGSSLARALLARGESVRGIDNFATGKRATVEALAGLEFHEGDICEAARLTRLCEGVDYILHQAAIPSVPRSVADPMATNHASVTGTLSVLQAGRAAGVKRIVYASSSSVYGNNPNLPKREEFRTDPVSPYAVAKLAGEQYMISFHRVYGTPTVSIRYFNVFGPGQDANSPYSAVLAKFITAMLQGKTPRIDGDGEQSRDFTYIDNVVSANLLACVAPPDKSCGRTFNVAMGQRISLNATYEILQRLTGFSGPAEHGPDRVGDVKHSLADIEPARQALGYEPIVSFEEGLRRTVEWYREQLAATGALSQASGR